MKIKSDEPLIAIILKGFAIISGLLALWRFAGAFSAPEVSMGGMTISQSGAYVGQAAVFIGTGLSLWWMAEITTLLGRIAANTGGQRSGFVAEPSVKQPEAPKFPAKRSVATSHTEEPPSYQL